jgi:hypothetical protein
VHDFAKTTTQHTAKMMTRGADCRAPNYDNIVEQLVQVLMHDAYAVGIQRMLSDDTTDRQ